jgi:hypothetical protein
VLDVAAAVGAAHSRIVVKIIILALIPQLSFTRYSSSLPYSEGAISSTGKNALRFLVENYVQGGILVTFESRLNFVHGFVVYLYLSFVQSNPYDLTRGIKIDSISSIRSSIELLSLLDHPHVPNLDNTVSIARYDFVAH